MKNKLIRITTVPLSLEKLLGGQLSFMKQYYDVIAVSSDEDWLRRIGIDQGVPVHYVELTRKITIGQDLKALWKLYRFFKKEKPDIVHSHTPKAGIIGMMAAKLARVPNRLHTVAGLPLMEATGRKRKVLSFVEKLTYRCATKVYPNSFGLKDIILEEKFCKETKLKVLANGSSNGIDTTYFDPALFSVKEKEDLKAQLNIQDGDFVFIFVGRIVKDKGIFELVTAFDRLQKQYAHAKLLLVGPFEDDLDPLPSEALRIIQENQHILSVGYQSDVRPYLSISNALVFPSYREGFPNVVMQAGAMGLPCIVTDINGCNEIILEGKNGLIIPPKNIEGLANAMLRYLSDADATQQMTAQARGLIVSRYEQHVVWEAILEEYKKLQ